MEQQLNTGLVAQGFWPKLWQKWSIAIGTLPLLAAVALAKFLSHYFGWEILELNALFTSLVGGTIFLIGFLVAGVLSDYKESEKIPSELTASLKTLMDDTSTIHECKDTDAVHQFMAYQQTLTHDIWEWFMRRERTQTLLDKISGMNAFFVSFDKEGVPANYIIKLKNEQSNLRRMLLRIDTIRSTDFVASAYAILEIMGLLIVGGLITIKIEPFNISLFFTLLITFLIAYMFLLIKCLDNPFDYSGHSKGGTMVSLKPLHDHLTQLDTIKTTEK